LYLSPISVDATLLRYNVGRLINKKLKMAAISIIIHSSSTNQFEYVELGTLHNTNLALNH